MVAAIEGVDVILAVDPDRSAIAEHDLVRDFRPALLDLERPLAAAEHHGHRVSPDLDRGDSERLARGQQVGSASEVETPPLCATAPSSAANPGGARSRPSAFQG